MPRGTFSRVSVEGYGDWEDGNDPLERPEWPQGPDLQIVPVTPTEREDPLGGLRPDEVKDLIRRIDRGEFDRKPPPKEPVFH